MEARFIPVGTGNTFGKTVSRSEQAVHPRGHGEHNKILFVDTMLDGSSPWARGTQDNSLVEQIDTRFIPVGTGNTRLGKFR